MSCTPHKLIEGTWRECVERALFSLTQTIRHSRSHYLTLSLLLSIILICCWHLLRFNNIRTAVIAAVVTAAVTASVSTTVTITDC